MARLERMYCRQCQQTLVTDSRDRCDACGSAEVIPANSQAAELLELVARKQAEPPPEVLVLSPESLSLYQEMVRTASWKNTLRKIEFIGILTFIFGVVAFSSLSRSDLQWSAREGAIYGVACTASGVAMVGWVWYMRLRRRPGRSQGQTRRPEDGP
jgi:hypothetical protein